MQEGGGERLLTGVGAQSPEEPHANLTLPVPSRLRTRRSRQAPDDVSARWQTVVGKKRKRTDATAQQDNAHAFIEDTDSSNDDEAVLQIDGYDDEGFTGFAPVRPSSARDRTPQLPTHSSRRIQSRSIARSFIVLLYQPLRALRAKASIFLK